MKIANLEPKLETLADIRALSLLNRNHSFGGTDRMSAQMTWNDSDCV